MKRILTFRQRINLSIKFWKCSEALVFMGVTSTMVGSAIDYTLPLIAGIIIVAVAIVFAAISMRLRYAKRNRNDLKIDRQIRISQIKK